MKIAIEGPSISNVDFNEILDIFKQTYFVVIMPNNVILNGFGVGGDIPSLPPLYESLCNSLESDTHKNVTSISFGEQIKKYIYNYNTLNIL